MQTGLLQTAPFERVRSGSGGPGEWTRQRRTMEPMTLSIVLIYVVFISCLFCIIGILSRCALKSSVQSRVDRIVGSAISQYYSVCTRSISPAVHDVQTRPDDFDQQDGWV